MERAGSAVEPAAGARSGADTGSTGAVDAAGDAAARASVLRARRAPTGASLPRRASSALAGDTAVTRAGPGPSTITSARLGRRSSPAGDRLGWGGDRARDLRR